VYKVSSSSACTNNLNCNVSSANPTDDSVPTESQEACSKDRSNYHAAFYQEKRKAKRQAEQEKRKQACDAAAKSVAEASAADGNTISCKYRPK
jgi:hypothetical protein